MSKEDFKTYVKKNPSFISYVKRGDVSWQGLYELFDLYGADDNVFRKYLSEEKNVSHKNNSFNELFDMAKNIDVDKIQNGVTSLQKALSLFSELFTSREENNVSSYKPRAIYKKFED